MTLVAPSLSEGPAELRPSDAAEDSGVGGADDDGGGDVAGDVYEDVAPERGAEGVEPADGVETWDDDEGTAVQSLTGEGYDEGQGPEEEGESGDGVGSADEGGGGGAGAAGGGVAIEGDEGEEKPGLHPHPVEEEAG